MRDGQTLVRRFLFTCAPFALAIALAFATTSARGADARDSALRRAARAEAFKPIVTGNDGATPVAESAASDAEIDLIKKAASDPLARPEPIRARPVRGVADQGEPDKAPERSAASTAETEAKPDAKPEAKPETKSEAKPETEREPQSEKPAAEKTEEKPADQTAADHDAAAPQAAREPAQDEEKPAAAPAADKAPVAKAVASAKPTKVNAVSGATALLWLQHGNDRYVKRHFRADGRSAADRARVLGGQHPHAVVLACADSRVPPEIVFDQALGEIFVVRVAGEALDAAVVASVEYAVEQLGSELLIVLGHSECGAVESALTAKEGESAGSEDLDKLIESIRPRLKTVRSEKPSANLEVESALNADGAAREIVRRSEILRKRVEGGHLLVKSALYRLDTGRVSFY